MTGSGHLLGGRYRLLDVLGRGGMAEVWAAEDEVLRRRVAVKLFPSGVDEAESRRAAAEMHTLAGLSHPNLVTVHDAGTDGDRAFLVMQLVSGPTLAARIASGPLSDADAVAIGTDVAAGLAYAHRRGITHRDVKPANVLLPDRDDDDDVTALLADFGIAHSAGAERLTGTGMTIGTAAYLAPEQVTGRAVGPPADVYALGLVLLETLGAAPPWTGTPVEIAMARLTNPPTVPPHLGPVWTPLLTAMTTAEPGARPTAAEVRTALAGGALPAAVTPTEQLPPPVPTAAATTQLLGPAPATTALLPGPGVPVGATATTADDERPTRRRALVWGLGGVAGIGVVAAVLAATLGSGAGSPVDSSTSGSTTPASSPVVSTSAPATPASTAPPATTPAPTTAAPTAPQGGGPGGGGPPGHGGPKNDKTKKPGK